MPEVEVLCIGNASYDISVFVSGFPAENSKAETDQLLEAGGGPAANAAYLLAAWQVPCAFAGMVGDDPYGQRIIAEFQAVGADISLVRIQPGYPTPLSLILVNRQNGSRTIVNRKLKDAPLHLSTTRAAQMSPRILLFDGHELEASHLARKLFPQAQIILDAGSWREGTAELAATAHYVMASERFALQACRLANLDNEELRRASVRQLKERYPGKVVITLGERGLIADGGGGYFHQEAFPVAVRDTTAAGDFFHGAFVFGLLQGISFKESLCWASMAAALSVTKEGGRLSLPRLNQVKEALAHAQ